MKKKLTTTFAAIHLGSEMLSMQITEYRGINSYKIIETCNKYIPLGEATFKYGIIPFSLVNEICEILHGFKLLMDEYGVDEYKLQATTAVREARNQIVLLDQIYSRTGLVAEVVDMPQEIYTKYVAICNTLREEKISADNDGILLLDISSGGLGVTFVQEEQIKYQENFHVGIIRLKESFDHNKRDSLHFNLALTEFLSGTIAPVRQELPHEKVRYLVLSGIETKLILKMMHYDCNQRVHRIKAEDFREFFRHMRQLNLPQLIKVYNIPENVAEMVLPTVVLYEQLLELAPADEIIVTADQFIDGMQMLHIGSQTAPAYRKSLDKELISLIHCIGQRYKYDKKHVQQVERLALRIFDVLAGHYGMGEHERLLLQAAALLHDIGKYVCMRNHSLYSYQLLMATDIFGFSNYDREIIALISYYQDNKLFDQTNKEAPAIQSSMVALVAKLSAIVRLADAMDRSYLQKIRKCTVTIKDKALLISASCKTDMSLEEWTFATDEVFFQEVFGLQAVLERVNE